MAPFGRDGGWAVSGSDGDEQDPEDSPFPPPQNIKGVRVGCSNERPTDRAQKGRPLSSIRHPADSRNPAANSDEPRCETQENRLDH